MDSALSTWCALRRRHHPPKHSLLRGNEETLNRYAQQVEHFVPHADFHVSLHHLPDPSRHLLRHDAHANNQSQEARRTKDKS